jgi:hypothetical protein
MYSKEFSYELLYWHEMCLISILLYWDFLVLRSISKARF